jgi:hypothetical protein
MVVFVKNGLQSQARSSLHLSNVEQAGIVQVHTRCKFILADDVHRTQGQTQVIFVFVEMHLRGVLRSSDQRKQTEKDQSKCSHNLHFATGLQT